MNFFKDDLFELLEKSKTIAVVGISENPSRASNSVASYLIRNGFEIFPVNPKYTSVLGEKCYPSLLDIPKQVDIVNIFMRSENVMPIVKQAIQIKAKAVWMQVGIENTEAAQIAEEAGLKVIMNRCIRTEDIKANTNL